LAKHSERYWHFLLKLRADVSAEKIERHIGFREILQFLPTISKNSAHNIGPWADVVIFEKSFV
jgi:hypothetical protein